jgi:hypothetical protein
MSEACPACGTSNPENTLLCSLCSHVLRRVTPAAPAPVRKRWMEPVFQEKSGRYHLGVGLLLACFFSLPFFLFKSIGWFFESLVHEMGHTLVSYALGSIALPALRLDGHAATVHLEPSVGLQIVVWLLLALGAGWFWLQRQRPLLITLAICVVGYPFLAFSSAKEWLFLIGGHGGELVIATIFLWRSLIPSHKVLPEERTLYAALGWYLWLQNLIMNWNLMRSEESRAWYTENGSFGLENDWIRLADTFGWSLEGTATVMLIAFLLAPPVGLLWARWSILRQSAHP